MSFKKTLTGIVLAGIAGLGLTGCSYNNNPEYHFNDKIEKEQVKFYERLFGKTNVLEVTKTDGIKVKYVDRNDNLKFDHKDYVEFTAKEGNKKRFYVNAPLQSLVQRDTVEEAQKQFDSYLKKIIETKTTSPPKKNK